VIALVQRVRQARVEVAARWSAPSAPACWCWCAPSRPTPRPRPKLLDKLLKLRIFSDEAGKMNRSVQDVAGGLLMVAVHAGRRHQRRQPAQLHRRGAGRLGRALYEAVLRLARERHPLVQAGVFGADMQVHLVNDGPVTIPLRIALKQARPSKRAARASSCRCRRR
jgi:D-tyrosyl-tRNA(Tyr) deacylase